MSDIQDKNNKSDTTVSLGRKTLSGNTPEKLTPRRRRKISRRKPGQKTVKNYFTMETQDAIVRYQEGEDETVKEKLYVKEILPAFDSLVENLINVYGYKIMHESKQDLKAECLEFLFSAIYKFDATKGSKAFSYYNVVAKNWLTIKSKQNAKKIKQYISLDNRDALSSTDIDTIERHNVIPGFDDVLTAEEMNLFLRQIVQELDKKTRTDNEKATLEAIKIIINRLDDIDLLSKRAVLLYIREITGLTSKQLSIVLSSLKKHYREIRKQEEFMH